MGRPIIDISGKKYNYLTAIERDGTRGQSPMWRCKCDCGAIVRVAGADLKSGRVASCRKCGTYRANLKRSKDRASVDKGNYLELDVSSNSVPNAKMKIDHSYATLVETGCYVHKGRAGLVYAYKGNKAIHRIITGCSKNEQVDHINGDTLDNRVSNLRVAAQSENTRNASRRKDNKSGYSGVRWHPRIKKWQASIKNNGKEIHLGYFVDVHEAGAVRADAEKRYGYHTNHGREQVRY